MSRVAGGVDFADTEGDDLPLDTDLESQKWWFVRL
jgi:hypothetical protein